MEKAQYTVVDARGIYYRIGFAGEFHDVETADLANEIAILMEEFKEVHSRAAATRSDSLTIEDIRNDLKAMEQEKEHLIRKIERLEADLRDIPNIQKILEAAGRLRLENRRKDGLSLQIQEQRNAIAHCKSKLQRLRSTLEELRSVMKDQGDPGEIVKQLQEELNTNRYIVEEKLPKEIESKKSIIAELSKIADMPAITERDIILIQEKISAVNEEILQLVKERENRDENTSELSIYRHQAAAVNRKKATLAEKLQKHRAELLRLELMVESKKSEIKSKTGEEDVISCTQFKKYSNDLRSKANSYRRKRNEIDDLRAEQGILAGTLSILLSQWNELKDQIEAKGGRVIEKEEQKQLERPRTAKPRTNDTSELKRMIKKLNDEVDSKKELISELLDTTNETNTKLTETQQLYDSQKLNYEGAQENLESAYASLLKEVQRMEEQISAQQTQANAARVELESSRQIIDRLEAAHRDHERSIVDITEENLESAKEEIEELQKILNDEPEDSGIDSEEQVRMWRSLLRILKSKLRILQPQRVGSEQLFASDTPIGDSSLVGDRQLQRTGPVSRHQRLL